MTGDAPQLFDGLKSSATLDGEAFVYASERKALGEPQACSYVSKQTMFADLTGNLLVWVIKRWRPWRVPGKTRHAPAS